MKRRCILTALLIWKLAWRTAGAKLHTASGSTPGVSTKQDGVIQMPEWSDWFYKSKRWQKCRNAFMGSKHYICEHCGRKAVIAHHKTHLTPANIHDSNISLNWDNLQALCMDCHAKVHGNGSAVPDGFAFDAEGNMVQVKNNSESPPGLTNYSG